MVMNQEGQLTPFPKHTPLAMSYVPFQQWDQAYDPAMALARGTVFPELDQPFIGEEAVSNGSGRKG